MSYPLPSRSHPATNRAGSRPSGTSPCDAPAPQKRPRAEQCTPAAECRAAECCVPCGRVPCGSGRAAVCRAGERRAAECRIPSSGRFPHRRGAAPCARALSPSERPRPSSASPTGGADWALEAIIAVSSRICRKIFCSSAPGSCPRPPRRERHPPTPNPPPPHPSHPSPPLPAAPPAPTARSPSAPVWQSESLSSVCGAVTGP